MNWISKQLLVFSFIHLTNSDIVNNGYLVFCPCMGRFGNQVDQFLGALAFAKGLQRTLVLPPWIMYQSFSGKIDLIQWEKVFNITVLNKYHTALSMDEFIVKKADQVWPKGDRTVFCYSARNGLVENSCNAKDGSPFGPFWNHFHVDFDKSIMFSPLNFQTNDNNLLKWRKTYPPSIYPVIAFTGAPASFPVQESHVDLQKYMAWNDDWVKRSENWVNKNLPKGTWLGIHLRNGEDWTRACEHTKSTKNLFSSPQCLGYRNEFGTLSSSICNPSKELILQTVSHFIKETSAVSVFVASDNDHMISFFKKSIKNVSFHKLKEDDLLLDLAILSQSSHFIGNCVSSFSAFIKRYRDVHSLPSSFWDFSFKPHHVEL